MANVENVKMSIKGKELTIKIDLSKELHPSKTGKTIIVADTGGNTEIEKHPDKRLMVKIFKYPPKKDDKKDAKKEDAKKD